MAIGGFTTAAGASLAASSSAEAGIIYVHPSTPVEATLSNGPSYRGFQIQHANLTINGWLVKPGVVNGTFSGIRDAGAGISGAEYYNGIKFFGRYNPLVQYFSLAKFARGSSIGGAFKSFFGFANIAEGTAAPFVTQGAFPLSNTGFAGFGTPNGRLGWLRLEVIDRNHDGYPDATEAIDWAFNNTPGANIEAGAVPEPSSISLALLATGASGLLAWRRRKASVAKPRG